MRLRLMLLVTWLAATFAAGLVVWAGVGLVAREVAVRTAPVLPPGEIVALASPAPQRPRSARTAGERTPAPDAATPRPRTPAVPGTAGPSREAPVAGERPEPREPREQPEPRAQREARPRPVVRTFSAIGGSVTVRVEDGVLSLELARPVTGYRVDVTDERPDRVEVRFRGDDAESRVRVRLRDGEPVGDIDEHGRG